MSWTHRDASAWHNFLTGIDPATAHTRTDDDTIACAIHLATQAARAQGRPKDIPLTDEEQDRIRRKVTAARQAVTRTEADA